MAKKFESPGYWAVIPAPVRYDDRIPANAKLLFGEISALCDRKGFCWAKNDYFAELYGWAPTTVTRLISSLRDAGYLVVEMVPTSGGSERRIFAGICTGGVSKIADTPLRKNVRGVSAKMITPLQYKGNNTVEHTPLTPHGGSGVQKRVHKDAPDWKPERFAGLWSYYPAKGRKNRQRAIAVWDKLKPDDALIDTMARALVAWKASDAWRRGIAIPYLERWLKEEMWLDVDELDAPDGSDGEEVTFGWQT